MTNAAVKVPIGYYFPAEANLPVVINASSVVLAFFSNMTIGVALLPQHKL